MNAEHQTVSSSPVPGSWAERYLALLGVAHEAPSLDALVRLTRAQMLTVPFENASSILRRSAHPGQPVPPLDTERVLASWEQREAGGVCYVISGMLTRLLLALGYQAHQVLADISFPRSHQAVIVELDGSRYLVDAGNNAPFLAPVPLGEPFEVHHAQLSYRFRPADAERYLQDRWIDGAWAPYCTYGLRPPEPQELEAAYQRHHTPGQSWVMDSLRLGRSTDDAHYSYRDQHFTAYAAPEKRREQVLNPAALARLATESFLLPSTLVLDSLAAQQAFEGTGSA